MRHTRKVVLVSNTSFTLTNFRKELIQSLSSNQVSVFIVCPLFCELSGESDVRALLRSLGAELIPVELSRQGINPLKDIKYFLSLIRVFKEIRPDVVMNYTIKPTIYSSIAARLCGINRIFSTVTGLGYVFTDKSLKATLLQLVVRIQYTIALRCNKLVFFQNDDDRALCKRKGLLKGVSTKIVNGSGVNTEFFSDVGSCEKKYDFILVARMLKDKGVLEFVSAVQLLREKGHDVLCCLLGPVDDNPTSFLMSEIESWVSLGGIEYISSKKDVRPFLRGSKVLVLPSYREGTPRSVLEAMSMGMPIITTDAPGCRETVVDGVNGFLVPVKDHVSLAEAMLKLRSPSLISNMGAESRIIAKSKYDVTLVNKAILEEVYK